MTTLQDDEIQTIPTDGTRIDPRPTPTGTTPTPTRRRLGRHGRRRLRRCRRRRRRHGRRVGPPSAALARCLEPVDAETFFDDHWEQRPLVVPARRARALRRPALRGGRRAARLLDGDPVPGLPARPRGPPARRRRLHEHVSWRPPFTSTADVPRVLAEWEAGATIVLQALHVNWHPLAVFCRLLEEALGHAVQANAYYTPRGSQGFAVHHDTHDVLVLQVAGEKRWLLYDPLLELPLKHQRYSLDARRARRADRRPRAPGR